VLETLLVAADHTITATPKHVPRTACRRARTERIHGAYVLRRAAVVSYTEQKQRKEKGKRDGDELSSGDDWLSVPALLPVPRASKTHKKGD
jgi:hypothetical protein